MRQVPSSFLLNSEGQSVVGGLGSLMAGIPVIPDLTHIYINFEFEASETNTEPATAPLKEQPLTRIKPDLINN